MTDAQLTDFYAVLDNPTQATPEWQELLRRCSSRPPTRWDELRYFGRLTVLLPQRPQHWLHHGRRGLLARVVVATTALAAIASGFSVGVSIDALAGRRSGGGVGLLFVLTIIASLAHEAGHVLAIASFGRRSDAMRVNVLLAFFHLDSDVTDLWSLRRSARLMVVLADRSFLCRLRASMCCSRTARRGRGSGR